MDGHVQKHYALVEVSELDFVSIFGMKCLVDFFYAEVTSIADPKDLTETGLLQVSE